MYIYCHKEKYIEHNKWQLKNVYITHQEIRPIVAKEE